MSSLLHELLLAPFPLPPDGRCAAAPATDLHIAFHALGSQRKVQLASPWLLRTLEPQRVGADWPAVCSAMHQFGGAVAVPAADLAAVDVSHMPVRIGTIGRDAPLDPDEIGTADLLEFDLRHPATRRWGWPIEFAAEGKLYGFIEALRVASGGDVPIGIVLPLNCRIDDLRKTMQCGVDFISLVADRRDTMQAWLLRGIRTARTCCIDEGMSDLPLLLDADLDSPWACFVCLALGASAVAVDAMLAPVPGRSGNAHAAGLLAGIVPDAQPAGAARGIEMLQEATDYLHEVLRLLGLAGLGDLSPDCLRAVREDVARIAGVEHL